MTWRSRPREPDPAALYAGFAPAIIFARMGHKHAPVEVRFWRFVQKTDSCWLWIGGTRKYGRISNGKGVNLSAHRVSYEMHVGPIPRGAFVCHSCDNPLCVRPDHLFLGTPKVNMDDMRAKGRARWGDHNRVKTHCKHGHPLTGDNIYSGRPTRHCVACTRRRASEYQFKKAKTHRRRVA